MRRVMRALRKDPLGATGVILLLLIVLLGLAPDVFATHDPLDIAVAERLLPPGGEGHLLGTDERGRDIWSRIVFGSAISLRAGILAVLVALSLGSIVGAVAGYGGRLLDEVLMRACDIFMSFPPLVLAMAIVAVIGPSVENATIAIALVWWPRYARLVRAQFLTLRGTQYVEAASALGARHTRIIIRHLMPNSLGPVVIQATLDVGYAILYTAALSFLGLGASPPTPEWGSMVSAGRSYLLDYWWIPTMPGLAVFVTVLAFNLVGDWLRDFLDPRV